MRAYGALKDDTSVLVCDIVTRGTTYPKAASGKSAREARRSAAVAPALPGDAVRSSGGCFCFGGGRRAAAVRDMRLQQGQG